MKIYIAGPVTGYGWDERKDFFAVWKKTLEMEGYEAVNPLEWQEKRGSWNVALRRDLQGLVTCDAILLTPGWEASRGVQLELHVSLALGLKVMFPAMFPISTPTRQPRRLR